MAAYRYEKTILLTQTHYQNRDLEEILLGGMQREELYRGIGIDAILRLIRTGNFTANSDTKSLIKNFVLSLGRGGVNLLPGTLMEYSKALEDEMAASLPYLCRSLKGSCDIIITDTISGDNTVSRALWKEADILAVTLIQNKTVIKRCLSQYRFPLEKTIFLIGKYQSASVNTVKYLERTYEELKGRLYAVPYHTSYMDALSEGTCMEFFLKSLAFKNKAGLTEFFSCVSQLAEMIFSKVPGEGGTGIDT